MNEKDRKAVESVLGQEVELAQVVESITWHGSITCSFCGKEITGVLIDGKTRQSSWATMCLKCFEENGIGPGMGKGQIYMKNKEDGFFYQIAG